MEFSMYSTFFYHLKRFSLVLLVVCSSPTVAQTRYHDETHDFGFRIGTGALSGINNTVHPLVDISSDFYFLSSDLRMIFGVSFIYPNSGEAGFSVAGLQYLGLEYTFPFLNNAAQIGVKTAKTYLKDATDIEGNRTLSLYLGYKHPLSQQTDYYVQLGIIRSPVKETTGDIKVDPYSMLFRTGIEVYF